MISIKTINGHKHLLYKQQIAHQNILTAAQDFFELMNQRRSIREFSDKEVSKKIIETLIKTASTAPSGAHKQPWFFCAISNTKLKRSIRLAAEAEEKISYERRMSTTWKNDLAVLGTDMYKPFLEEAPWLIVLFKKAYDLDNDGNKTSNYYVNESVGIAAGMLITAIHQAGLITLTHTPSPMHFLTKILERPSNERPFLLLPVGYPKKPTYVPNLERKSLKDMAAFYE